MSVNVIFIFKSNYLLELVWEATDLLALCDGPEVAFIQIDRLTRREVTPFE